MRDDFSFGAGGAGKRVSIDAAAGRAAAVGASAGCGGGKGTFAEAAPTGGPGDRGPMGGSETAAGSRRGIRVFPAPFEG